MGESELYMEAKDWEMMYTILLKGMLEATGLLAPLAENKGAIDALLTAIMKACEYRLIVCEDFTEEELAEMRRDLTGNIIKKDLLTEC